MSLDQTSKPEWVVKRIREILRKVDPEYLSRKLRMDLKETKSEAGTKKLAKRLEGC